MHLEGMQRTLSVQMSIKCTNVFQPENLFSRKSKLKKGKFCQFEHKAVLSNPVCLFKRCVQGTHFKNEALSRTETILKTRKAIKTIKPKAETWVWLFIYRGMFATLHSDLNEITSSFQPSCLSGSSTTQQHAKTENRKKYIYILCFFYVHRWWYSPEKFV